MNEDKSARYHRLQRRASIASLAWTTVLLVTLAATSGSARLRDAVGAVTDSPAAAIAVYVLALTLLHEIGAFPLAFYSGYVLEHRYGLSRQTPRAWLADHLKGIALALVLITALASLMYWSMRAYPERWWLVSGLLFAALLVVLAQLAPVVLLPLFFRFRPLDAPALRDRLERLAERAGARVMGVFRWELGRKTSKANAALAGIGRTRRIIIADTMLDQYSDDEIEVVLAHELAHHVYRDIWTGIASETGLTLVGFYAAHRVLAWIGPRAGLTSPADPAGLPLLCLAAGAVSVVLMPVALALSRRNERRADRFALELTRNPGAFTSAMRRLGAQNLAEERPSRVVEWLFYSHPPLNERLDSASRWESDARPTA
jgi:Zn-dependent protease with chaperone function